MYLVDNSWAHFYNLSDSNWIIDSINSDNMEQAFTNSQSILSFLATSSIIRQHFYIDQLTKISYLDNMLMRSSTYLSYSKHENLYIAFSDDVLLHTSSCCVPLASLMQSEYQDNLMTMVAVTPELSLILDDYIYTYLLPGMFCTDVISLFDSYSSSFVLNYDIGVAYYLLFAIYVWTTVYSALTSISLSWAYPTNFQFVRFMYYTYSISREIRVQLESTLQTLVFFTIYWVAMLMTFDDNREESMELIDSTFFYFFVVLISYILYKYSIHYFTFLEASVVGGRSISFIFRQIFKDFLNTLSLSLRFYTLLFRINVYDTLDDFFDSYYIFIGDFDDDEYLSELFLAVNASILYISENDFDSSFLMEDENDFFGDMFYLYFLVWGKIFYFAFFVVEEAFRLGLAFYVCYLITFEVHSVNCSYKEDSFIFEKRFR